MLALQKFSRMDRFVDAAWRMVTWVMISSLSLGSLVLLYFAMMLAFSGKWDDLAAPAGTGLMLAFAVALLCRYRTDLIGN